MTGSERFMLPIIVQGQNLKLQRKFLIDVEGMCQEQAHVLCLEIKVFLRSETLKTLWGLSVPLVTVGQQLLI
jgi:hypothetical protein